MEKMDAVLTFSTALSYDQREKCACVCVFQFKHVCSCVSV